MNAGFEQFLYANANHNISFVKKSADLGESSRGKRDCFQCCYGRRAHMSIGIKAVPLFPPGKRVQQNSRAAPCGNG
jgi:hypothetical protein